MAFLTLGVIDINKLFKKNDRTSSAGRFLAVGFSMGTQIFLPKLNTGKLEIAM